MAAVLDKIPNKEVSPEVAKQLETLVAKSFLEKYNQFGKIEKKLDAMLDEEKSSNPFIRGLSGAFLNRAHGLTQVKKLGPSALEGYRWMRYFLFRPEKELQQDVEKATKAWAWHKFSPSFKGVKILAATSYGSLSGQAEIVATKAKHVSDERAKSLGYSVAVSGGISYFLKCVGKTSGNEVVRQTARYSRGLWTVTGLFGLVYGLSRIHEAMSENELKPFSQSLRGSRDNFEKSVKPGDDAQVVDLLKRIEESQ